MSVPWRVRTAAIMAVVLTVGLASLARGSSGQAVILGQTNTSGLDTTINGQGDAIGLVGISTEYGLEGVNTTGGEGAGVWGIGQNGAAGVQADGSIATGSDALDVEGRSAFNGPTDFVGSGVATIPAGSASVTAPVDSVVLDAYSRALATLQQHRATEVAAAVVHVNKATVTIYLSRPVAQDTKVAWFVLG